jgi:dolichol kinase
MARPLFACRARHLEHAVCLVTTLASIWWRPRVGEGLDLDQDVVGALGRGLVCLNVCVLAICVEEAVVIPAAQGSGRRGGVGDFVGGVGEGRSKELNARHAPAAQASVYRHASNPGLALGACVVPWVCLALDLRWASACAMLSANIMLLWTGVFERGCAVCAGQTGEASTATRNDCTAVGVSLWILGWCTWHLCADLMGVSAGLSLCWVSSALATFFSLRRLVPGTWTMGESVAASLAVAGVVGEVVVRIVRGEEPEIIGTLVAAGLLAFMVALMLVVGSARGGVGRMLGPSRLHHAGDSSKISGLMTTVALAILIAGSGVLLFPFLRRLPGLVAQHGQDPASVGLLAYWTACLAVALPCMIFLKNLGLRNIIVRKGFHALALLLFVPPMAAELGRDSGQPWLPRTDAHDPLLPLALAGAFLGFLALEIIRLGDIPLPFGVERPIQRFMALFVDERDTQGELYVTHITLLLGLAVPIWLGSDLEAFAGIIMTGVGDALASVVGSLCGQRTIAVGTKKTAEGAAACFVSMILSWWSITAWFGVRLTGAQWAAVAASTGCCTLLESVTDSMDNIFVSSVYFCLLTGLFS